MVYESHAMYWRNGVPIQLPGKNGRIASIVVAGNDVYVAGTIDQGGTGGAVYWKNGVLVNLFDGQHTASATSIAVSGEDIHVSGNGYDDNSSEGIAKYWKNGVDIP